MHAPARAAVAWTLFSCVGVSVTAPAGAVPQQKERLLHVPGAVLLLGYPEDDMLFVTRGGEELTLQPPGPNRGGHPTFPSLSRDGRLVATSYVKSPYPNYREGVAVYSLIDKQWTQYGDVDFQYVWATTISPDGSVVAVRAEREHQNQLLLLNLQTGDMNVLPVAHQFGLLSWSADGRYVVYPRPLRQPKPNVDSYEYEIRILDVMNGQDRALAEGLAPAWSPSGEWIAYVDNAGGVTIVHPDGTGMTPLVRLRRSLPWFTAREFMYPPVWSPDSTALLLNEAALDETARASIHHFDLGARTLRKKAGKGVAILGWSRCSAP